MDKEIAWQNKDIVAKVFGENMLGKPLSLFGWKSELKVAGVLPTNLPAVQANELRIDNLFQLEDGSLAIIDYESTYKEHNMLKYMSYVVRVLERYPQKLTSMKIQMMVLYTADVEKVNTEIHVGCMDFTIQASYLSGVDSDQWLSELTEKTLEQNIGEEDIIHLVMLPLTYQGQEAKQKAIENCIALAQQLEDKEKETFILAGILAFTDKVITEEMQRRIKERITMTKVGNLLIEQGEKKALKEKVLRLSQQKGFTAEQISDLLGIDMENINAWLKESGSNRQ